MRLPCPPPSTANTEPVVKLDAALAELPAALRAKIRLIHYPDSFELEGSDPECLRQGRRYAI